MLDRSSALSLRVVCRMDVRSVSSESFGVPLSELMVALSSRRPKFLLSLKNLYLDSLILQFHVFTRSLRFDIFWFMSFKDFPLATVSAHGPEKCLTENMYNMICKIWTHNSRSSVPGADDSLGSWQGELERSD